MVRRWIPCLLAGLLLSACVRPSQERAQRDAEIGSDEAAGVRLVVAGGHAAVRALGAEAATLWQNAPVLELELGFSAAPPAVFELNVSNCMLGAELSAPAGTSVQAFERSRGQCRFVLSLEPGVQALALRLAPPGANTVRPFRFAVLSDIQEAIEGVQDIYDRINTTPDVEFVLGVGDLTQQGTVAQLEQFQAYMQGLALPYYVTLGNHELGESPPRYHDYFGRGSSSFEYRGVRFTLVDSASATVDPIVYGWLDGWLALGADQPHVVAMHVPPLDPIGVRNGAFASRAEAGKLLAKLASANVDLTLYGHIHSYYRFDNAGIPAQISGGGGAIPERFDDMGRHFLAIDVDPDKSTFATTIVRVD